MQLFNRLQSAFIPKAVAVVGASDRVGSRGTYVWNGVMNGRRALEAYPVNPKYKYIGVTPCWASLSELPTQIDLAVIATPAKSVMGLLKECAKLGIPNVLLTPGDEALTGDRHWRAEVTEFARRSKIRLIGPDSMGIMRPSIGLNVSYWPQLADCGSIGLLSQSGAVMATILTYAAHSSMGFSSVISSGLESDVKLAEIVDFLADDPKTGIIALHIETLRHPRAFYSAVRMASRRKPVIVLKAGRCPSSARLIAGRLSAAVGSEAAFDAMLERAGAIRCDRIEEFCSTLEVFAAGKNPREGRLAVIANGLGFAALAADACDACNVRLADLSAQTERALRPILRSSSALMNPVALGSDATPEAFSAVLEQVVADDQVDGAVIALAPSPLTESEHTVELIARIADNTFKPVIVNWLSDIANDTMLRAFKRCRLPVISTPELTARAFAHLARYEALKRERERAPLEGSEDFSWDRNAAAVLVEQAKKAQQFHLSESETAKLLAAFGIRTLSASFAETAQDAVDCARRIGFPVAVKVAADGIAHKTDVGGVVLNVAGESQVTAAFHLVADRLKKHAPMALFKGVFVQKMADRQNARELMIRAATDPILGPAVYFGAGGRTGDIFGEETIALAPLSEPIAHDLIERHRARVSLEVFRGLPAVKHGDIVETLMRVSRMMCEVPAVSEVTINPLIADDKGVIALDASVALCARSSVPEPDYPHMLICPSPAACDEEIETRSGAMRIRSIRADDVAPLKRLLSRLSQRTAYMRLHKKADEVTHTELIDFTHINHDREAARVVTDTSREAPEMHAVGRIFLHHAPDGCLVAEFGILVEDSFQHAGLGSVLMQRLEDESRRRGAARIEGYVLKGNDAMAALMSKRGYRASDCPQDANMLIYSLPLVESRPEH